MNLPAKDLSPDSQVHLRTWVRLLSCTSRISQILRRRLRSEFGITSPRFDLLAQVYREPLGMRLTELSRKMMVTNGNVTGLIGPMVAEGFIDSFVDPTDSRATKVKLTPDGRRRFEAMARIHQQWVEEIFGEMGEDGSRHLCEALEPLRASAKKRY